ncbi:MAG TPA: hypothetical protein VKF61_06625 [Candidatus Polarisedimenticolia bacterium]|nr:hypothetical protein [Candidatus Polarisedimenticolia bacterium]
MTTHPCRLLAPLQMVSFLLSIGLVGPLAFASQVRSLNLEEMTDRAARIFSGRCTEAEVVFVEKSNCRRVYLIYGPRAIDMYGKVLDGFASVPASGQARRVFVAAQQNLCDAQIAMRRLQEALATCGEATRLAPDNPIGFYNLAGAHALLGRNDEALAALTRDLELGDSDWQYLQSDPWFERLHSDRRFMAIVAKMKKGKARSGRSS